MAIDVNRMIHLFGLDGKVAVVTGGSRGIGYMIVGGLLDAGCRVIISARKEHQVKAGAAELGARGHCRAIPADLSTPEGCEARFCSLRSCCPGFGLQRTPATRPGSSTSLPSTGSRHR